MKSNLIRQESTNGNIEKENKPEDNKSYDFHAG